MTATFKDDEGREFHRQCNRCNALWSGVARCDQCRGVEFRIVYLDRERYTAAGALDIVQDESPASAEAAGKTSRKVKPMSTATKKPPLSKRDPRAQIAEAYKEQRKLKHATNKEKLEGAFLAEFDRQAAEYAERTGHKLPAPVREHRFVTGRKWRFDIAWPWLRLPGRPLQQIAVEIHGGTRIAGGGRHQRAGADGIKSDADKNNEAQRLGWRVFVFTDQHDVKAAVAQVIRVITE